MYCLGKDMYWEEEVEQEEYPCCWWYRQSRAHNVEMTSYALLTYTHKQRTVDGAKIVSWMAKQRNSQGGFRSTQVSCNIKDFYKTNIHFTGVLGEKCMLLMMDIIGHYVSQQTGG